MEPNKDNQINDRSLETRDKRGRDGVVKSLAIIALGATLSSGALVAVNTATEPDYSSDTTYVEITSPGDWDSAVDAVKGVNIFNHDHVENHIKHMSQNENILRGGGPQPGEIVTIPYSVGK